MDLTFIRISENLSEDCTWLRINETGRAGTRQGNLADAADDARGSQLVLVVPSEQVLLTKAAIPTKKTSLRLKAIPNLINDEIASDPEDLHFSIGPDVGDDTSIAVVDRQLIEGWTGLCKAHSIEARAIVPDVLCLPWQRDEWTVFIGESTALVRTGLAEGFSCHPALVDTLLASALDDDAPVTIRAYRCHEGALNKLNEVPDDIDIIEMDCGNGLLEILSNGWNANTTLDLQQGEYGRGQNLALRLKPWRWAAILAGILLLLNVLGTLVEQQRLVAERDALDQEIEALFRANFPNAKSVSGIRKRMGEKLAALGEVDDQLEMLPVLTQSAEVVMESSGSKIENIGFRQNTLELLVSAPSLSDLDALKNRVAEVTGLAVDMNANSIDGKNIGTIKIAGAKQ